MSRLQKNEKIKKKDKVMEKYDYSKELKTLYKPSPKTVQVIDVPEMAFLKIDGQGDPNHSEEFSRAVEALYALSYAIKFFVKKNMEMDYRVFPLEGLWWADDMSAFNVDDKANWKWTLMIAQPGWVDAKIVAEQNAIVAVKKNLTMLELLRYETYLEGETAQIMHIGPFSEEGPTIKKVHDFILESGKQLTGLHHEIYLSDIRKGKPENWKTVIRQPFK